ncbi:MAG: membrane protein insertase YidC [Candidatus Krumholzibacteriota bacterium]|nr:membrane protein insertase YidC [Candidatus Krumholzibacteriota bacterium]
MDKRSLTAVLITFVILIVWQFLYVMPRQKAAYQRRMEIRREQALDDSLSAREKEDAPPAEEIRTEAEGEEATFAQTAPAPGRTAGFWAGPQEGEERELIITTDKMIVTLSNRGGEITGIKLPEFKRKNGEPVEIIPAGARGGISISLDMEGREEKLAGHVFEATVDGRGWEDREEIVLGETKDKTEVIFRRKGPGGESLEKRFEFSRDGYEVGVTVSLEREGELHQARGYAVSWDCGMAVNEKDISGDKRQFAALGKVGEEFYKESARSFGKTDLKEQEGMVLWAGARTKYFISAMVVAEHRSSVLGLRGDKETGQVGYSISYPFRGDPRRVEDKFLCYFGPLDMVGLKEYGVGLEKAIDLGRLRFFSVFVLRMMVWMKRFIPNYGVIIIILSIMTKVIFYRLTHKSFRSMKDMQRLQPKLKELQEKYKNNKEKLNKETMKMYKEAGVNPLGGCLPLLLQMPVFIALFNVLRNTIELRDAPFVLWINDLSSPDVLFNFGTKLPLLGSECHILPLLMGGAMFLQSKMGGSPTGEGVGAAQTKMMSTMMPIVFTFIFYGMPSGLVLYWIVNNILSIIQQYYAHQQIEKENALAPAGAGESGQKVNKRLEKGKTE